MAALGAVLCSSLLFCASAWAKTPLTITFTSPPPDGAVAGGSYEVSATSSAGLPVSLSVGGACSFSRPAASQTLEHEVVEEQPLVPRESPAIVYFVEAGTCTIEASYFRPHEDDYEGGMASQSFPVAKDPSQRITFISNPPNEATVGEKYHPTVQLSPGIRVAFLTTTPSVCTINEAAVNLVGVGTCTVAVRQDGASESEPPEAQQSFTVSTSSPGAKRTVTEVTHVKTIPKGKYLALCRAKASKCATLIIHVYLQATFPKKGTIRTPKETSPLRIAKLGSRPRCTVELPDAGVVY